MSRYSPRARQALAAAAALTLAALLAYLYARTAGDDLKAESRALETLRELKDLDLRWDADAPRLVADLGASGIVPDTERPARAQRLVAELSRAPAPAAIANETGLVRKGFEEKAAAWSLLLAAHQRSRAAHAEAVEALESLERRVRAARGPRAGDLPLVIERIRSGMRDPDASSAPARMESEVALLIPAARALDPLLGEPAGLAHDTVRAFVRQREAEANAARAFTFHTVGARVERAARELSAAMSRELDARAPWRAYLLAYALALLIGCGYLAMRVASTQAALRRANEGLEQRVEERTRELRETLERLKESEAQLVQTEKMSSLGQMVAGVAHEINTPLAYVKNSMATARDRMPELRAALADAQALLALLGSEDPDPAKLQEAFDALSSRLEGLSDRHVLEDLETLTRDGLHGIDEIAELVRNLRTFSRLDRSRMASFNVNEGVRSTMLIARSTLRKVDLDLRLGDLPSINCSPSQVNQVLLNLVNNAVQAMDKPRGKLVVETRPTGEGIAIEVTDDGRGMTPEVQRRIFDPFFTTKPVGQGTGLGLAIAYKIVTEHGGRIDVRSQPGEGTTFTVTLPIEPPEALAREAGKEKAEAMA